MSDLLEQAIAAHGGLDRWNAFRNVSLDLSVGGALWDFKGQTGLFADAAYEADIHRQRATLGLAGAKILGDAGYARVAQLEQQAIAAGYPELA